MVEAQSGQTGEGLQWDWQGSCGSSLKEMVGT